MRLFTGISLPPQIAAKIDIHLKALRPLAVLNWSPLENLHITTKFIGSWPEDRLEELDRSLATIPSPDRFEVRIAGFDFYRTAFFAAVEAPPALFKLADLTDKAVEALGHPRETRPYSPHLTLARIRNDNMQELPRLISPTDFGTFPVTEFHLYASKPGPDGSVYKVLRTYSLC